MEIRLAGPSDFQAAWEIIAEYQDSVGVVVRDDRLTLQPYLQPPYGLWLACTDGQVVGCIALRPLSQERGEIKRLYVKPAFRGQGLADRLLDALEHGALQLGYRTLYLDTKDDLEAAIRFYQRRGYREVERYNDNPQATRFMARDLDPGRKQD